MANNNFNLVNDCILREIKRKKELLTSNPHFHLNTCRRRKKALQKEAAKHSVSLEMEGYGTTNSEGRRLKAREQKRCEENLFGALEWGLNFYDGKLSDDFIRQLGVKVDPQNCEGFRDRSVKILGARISPPSADKVRRELAGAIVVNNSLESPIEKAFHSHLHLVRAHPFFDGNGRVARLIQNIILEKGEYFPIVIKRSDRKEYFDLIEAVIYSRWIAEGELGSRENNEYIKAKSKLLGDLTPKERDYRSKIIIKTCKKLMTPEQNDFYNFLALKIRDVLQSEIERCYN